MGIAGQSKHAYQAWTELSEGRVLARFLGATAQLKAVSVVAVVVDTLTKPLETQRTVDSVTSAFGSETQILRLDHGRVEKGLFDGATHVDQDRWLLVLSPGDIASPHLKCALEVALCQKPDASVVYWDTDDLVEGRRTNPFIKPAAWDPVLHMQADCLSSASIVRMDKAKELTAANARATGSIDLWNLGGHVASRLSANEFVHVPLILTHLDPAGHRHRLGEVPLGELGFPEPQRWPSVGVIIPTRDRLELLSECLSSVARTKYPGRVDIIVVDNGSEEAETKAYLEAMAEKGRIAVIDAPGPFNFARLNNAAVDQIDSEFLCLLNNDVTVIDGEWLASLVRVGMGENVGAVGPMLLYPDDTIQHAGVAIGIGNAAGHIERGIRPGTKIHPTWTAATRRVSAVTAACLLVRRSDYLAVGGLDEADFAVAFNDVDLCLKLQQLGRRNIYLASVALHHHESKSRGSDLAAANVERFSGELDRLHKKWRTQSHEDPWFSPLFSRASERCVLDMLAS